jgi:L-threonylcarbamoyladenylate synthase
LENDGVIAFPTDTVWGLGCNPDNKKAVEKIYNLKARDAKKPLILMSSSLDYLIPYVKNLSGEEKDMAEKFFPGALTIITEKSSRTQNFVTSNLETVGIRVPNHKVFMEIANLAPNKVLATTSANLSTQPSALKKTDVQKYFGEKLDYIADDFGYFSENLESTIIVFKNNGWHVLRQGVIKIGNI